MCSKAPNSLKLHPQALARNSESSACFGAFCGLREDLWLEFRGFKNRRLCSLRASGLKVEWLGRRLLLVRLALESQLPVQGHVP